jgi:hypothetical protein
MMAAFGEEQQILGRMMDAIPRIIFVHHLLILLILLPDS